MTTPLVSGSSFPGLSIGSTITVTLPSEWKVRNSVAQSEISEWNLSGTVQVDRLVRFNYLDSLTKSVSCNFNTLQQVVPGQNIYFRVGINPSGPVQVQKQISFNNLSSLTRTQNFEWKESQRLSMTEQILFNVDVSLITGLTIRWNVGKPVQSHIRQTAQIRTDFAY